jgi:hypothetical protein
MHSRRFRLGLLLAVLAGLASCEINPQPPLPGDKQSNPPGVAGSLNLGEGTSGAQSGPSCGTGNDSSTGGSLVIDMGGGAPQGSGGVAGNSDVPTPGDGGAADAGGAGGATDAGGAGGATDAGGPVAEPGPR